MPLVRSALAATGSVLCQSHSVTKPRGRSGRACVHALLTTASHGSNRPCVEMALEGVSQCCSVARARRKTRCRWYAAPWQPLGACCAKATASPSHVGASGGLGERPRAFPEPQPRSRTERLPTALRTATIGRAWGCLLKCCSVARARREPRHHWYGGLGGCPRAYYAGATASPSHV